MVPVGPGTAWAGGKHCHFPPDAEFPGMQREVVKSHRFSSTFQRKPGRPASHSALLSWEVTQNGQLWGCRTEAEAYRPR